MGLNDIHLPFMGGKVSWMNMVSIIIKIKIKLRIKKSERQLEKNPQQFRPWASCVKNGGTRFRWFFNEDNCNKILLLLIIILTILFIMIVSRSQSTSGSSSWGRSASPCYSITCSTWSSSPLYQVDMVEMDMVMVVEKLHTLLQVSFLSPDFFFCRSVKYFH